MTRARDVSRLVTTPPDIYATDSETSLEGYLTNASASTIYATISSNKVVQIVYASTSSDISVTSATFTDTDLTATITPTSASNKILILATNTISVQKTNPAAFAAGGIRLLRGATVIQATNTDGGFYILAGTTSPYGVEKKSSEVIYYLDDPATTSATTYKTQMAIGTGAGTTVRTGFDGSWSSMILMEVTP
jgi:hypothetical protein